MEKQIENILIKVDEGTMPVQQALSELLRLFSVSCQCEACKQDHLPLGILFVFTLIFCIIFIFSC